MRAGHRLVPLLPRRGHLLLRGPRLLFGGGLRLPRRGQPRLSLCRRSTRLPRISLGPLGRRDLRLEPGPLLGLVPRGVPAGLRQLLLRGPAHPVQLHAGRLGRLPRPCRVLPGLAGPDSASAARDSAPAARDCAPVTASSRSCRAAATCSCAARASCSAAAFASRAAASRASASAAAARACRASASACSARA